MLSKKLCFPRHNKKPAQQNYDTINDTQYHILFLLKQNLTLFQSKTIFTRARTLGLRRRHGYIALIRKGPRSVAYRMGFGGSNPPPEIPKALQNRAKLNPIVKNVKQIAEFRTPTPQDVLKKCSKILKLPRFTIVLH
jgi:hypothetical protein